ncbi:hypothetical protein PNEG_00074 [Pneumocystis murina B123]|uniref:ML-like domain-containing protein n=1 Tax=Pneumocystis murina (strain B123) TaxID=1069680 RepID=M7NWV2_PNEMU|nr:hypothetical protein PNEG_00074 [Pneumocystis murina B123]EMR11636.1 hypothetical protein PNEG_00074 [Pneumocystis murina B123]
MKFFIFGFILIFFWNGLISCVNAKRGIGTRSMSTCMENSGLIATVFRITYYPDLEKMVYRVDGMTSIEGEVIVNLIIMAYGIQVLNKTIDPCILKMPQLCYLQPGPLTQIEGESDVPVDITSHIPGVVYAIPDIDVYVKVMIYSKHSGDLKACVQVTMTNMMTVNVKTVGWISGLIALSALIVSAIAWENGNSNTAHHIATNAFALFSYFQGQAMFGMMSAKMPPIVRAWTQNFQWTMGIINLGFMQKIFTWYIKSTGGLPSYLHSSSLEHSIILEKRDFHLEKRASNNFNDPKYVFRGIHRVAYSEQIETTNLFMTSFSFFLIMVFIMLLGFALFRILIHYSPKIQWIRNDRFFGFKNEWKDLLKGTMYRLLLIGYPQLSLLCIWELISRDSIGAMIYAIISLIVVTGLLSYAAYWVIVLARRSLKFHKTAAYILYSDSGILTKWGSLYIQFSASAYYFIVPLLLFILLRSFFIALCQSNSLVQAIGYFVIELVYFFLIVYIRPFLDRKTNIFSITVASIDLLNSIFILIFANESRIYSIVVAVFGIIFFIINCIFALILLVLLIIVSIYALVSENPDILHEQMQDDRSEFIKSKTNFSNLELNLSNENNGSNFKEMSTKNHALSSYDRSYSLAGKVNNTNSNQSGNFLSSYDLIANYISQNPSITAPQPPFKSSMRSSNDSLFKDLQGNKDNMDVEYVPYRELNIDSSMANDRQFSNIHRSRYIPDQNSHAISFSDLQSRQYIPGAPKKTRNYGLYYNTYTSRAT